jgi:hypothetical protein
VAERTVEQIRAERAALDKELEEKLAKEREKDLELVKEKIKLHKFTKTQLRSVLPNRRKSKSSDNTPKKS